MNHIEPTYLRFVYDKLEKGILNSENPSSLPDGFVGIYEQEFMANTSVDQRQNTLLKFGLWSLFKSAVSIETFSLVFNVQQSEIRVFIDSYSNWFNSPEPGRYQLYHDRIKVFFLQKLKNYELQELNERLISSLLKSIKAKNGDSTEKYALEHLSTHMALESMMGHEYERLHQFVNNESIWTRQIDISNGYEWSQKAIQHGIKEGARRQDELNTLRSTVNSVKLMQQEQNSAEYILKLLNRGDYQTALRRAETWEGERQFKLYLLMIHELTIGDCKDASFKIEALELIIQAIDDTPIDHTILDWSNFYPEIAVFKYIYELYEIGIDGSLIWKRNNGQYSLIDVLNSCSTELDELITFACSEFGYKIFLNQGDQNSVTSELIKICEILLQKRQLDELDKLLDLIIEIASNIQIEDDKIYSFEQIGSLLVKVGEKDLALQLIKELDFTETNTSRYNKQIVISLMENDCEEIALNLTLKITKNLQRNQAFYELVKLFLKTGNTEKAIELASKIDNFDIKLSSYKEISAEMSKLGLIDELIFVGSNIESIKIKSFIYMYCCRALHRSNTKENALILINKINSLAKEIDFDGGWSNEDEILSIISSLYFKAGNKLLANNTLAEIEDGYYKDQTYSLICNFLIQEKEIDEAIKTTKKINDIHERCDTLKRLSIIAINSWSIEISLKLVNEIASIDLYSKDTALVNVALKLIENNDFENAYRLIKKAKNQEVTDDFYLTCSEILLSQGHEEKCIDFISNIQNPDSQVSAITVCLRFALNKNNISSRSFLNDLIKLILEFIKRTNDDWIINYHLKEILTLCYEYSRHDLIDFFVKQSLFIRTKYDLFTIPFKGLSSRDKDQLYHTPIELSFINEMIMGDYLDRIIYSVMQINDIYEKESVLIEIAKLLVNNKNIDTALSMSDYIETELNKNVLYQEISRILLQEGDINKALNVSNKIDNVDYSCPMKSEISIKLLREGREKMAYEIADTINDAYYKDDTYVKLIEIYLENNKIQLGLNLITKIYTSDERDQAYTKIIDRLIKNKNSDQAISLISKFEDAFQRDLALSNISYSLAKNHQLDMANEILNKIEDEYSKDESYYKISEILLKENEINASLNLIMKIKDTDLRDKALVNQIDYLFSIQKTNDAIKLAKVFFEKDLAFSEISKNMIKYGLLKKGKSIIENIKDEYYRDSTISDSIIMLFDKSRINEAFKLLEEIKIIELKDETLIKLSEKYILQEKNKEALDIAIKITSSAERNKIITSIARKSQFKNSLSLENKLINKKNKEAFIKGISEQLRHNLIDYSFIFPYLYNFSSFSNLLPNILISETKNIYVEGFDSNKEKLKILREVVVI